MLDAVTEVERLCEVMHDAYEAAAVSEGWETQQSSRKPWAGVPEDNKATMRVAVVALLIDLHRQGRLRQGSSEDPRVDGGDAARLDGQAWADLTADRDRYRGELRALLDDMAVVHEDDRLGYVDVQVSRAELDDARRIAGSAS